MAPCHLLATLSAWTAPKNRHGTRNQMNAPTRKNGRGAPVDLFGLQEMQGVRTEGVHLTALIITPAIQRISTNFHAP